MRTCAPAQQPGVQPYPAAPKTLFLMMPLSPLWNGPLACICTTPKHFDLLSRASPHLPVTLSDSEPGLSIRWTCWPAIFLHIV